MTASATEIEVRGVSDTNVMRVTAKFRNKPLFTVA